MAKRIFMSEGFTPVAVADNLVFTDAGYMAIQGGSSTQRNLVREINIGGLATASAPTPFVFSLDIVVGATLTALAAPNSDGPMDTATAALAAPPVSFVASTTKPKRGTTAVPKLNLGLNAFGGIMYWVAAQGEEFVLLGNGVNAGEGSLSAFTGGTPGLVSAHIVYEPL